MANSLATYYYIAYALLGQLSHDLVNNLRQIGMSPCIQMLKQLTPHNI